MSQRETWGPCTKFLLAGTPCLQNQLTKPSSDTLVLLRGHIHQRTEGRKQYILNEKNYLNLLSKRFGSQKYI